MRGKLKNIQYFGEQYNNHSNIVKFHKNNTVAQVYRYTHTLCLIYNRKLVQCNNIFLYNSEYFTESEMVVLVTSAWIR